MEARENGITSIKYWKRKKSQQEFCTKKKHPLRIKANIKTVLGERHLREFVANTYALKEMQKEVLQVEEKWQWMGTQILKGMKNTQNGTYLVDIKLFFQNFLLKFLIINVFLKQKSTFFVGFILYADVIHITS